MKGMNFKAANELDFGTAVELIRAASEWTKQNRTILHVYNC